MHDITYKLNELKQGGGLRIFELQMKHKFRHGCLYSQFSDLLVCIQHVIQLFPIN